MGSKFTKERKFQKSCKNCLGTFFAADVKASFCDECKKPGVCQCGCGEATKTRLRKYKQGHACRIDSEAMQKGHRSQSLKIRGENNPSVKNPEILSRAMIRYWALLTDKEKRERTKNHSYVLDPNQSGSRYKRTQKGFRLEFEEQVSSILEEFRVEYQYEKVCKFSDGSRFYPDFTINTQRRTRVFIEVSGFAYKQWQDIFVKKVDKILEDGYSVISVTYPSFLDLMRSRISSPCFTLEGFRSWVIKSLGSFNLITDIGSGVTKENANISTDIEG